MLSTISLITLVTLFVPQSANGRMHWLERHGRPLLVPRRFGQEHPPVIDQLSNACGNGICATLAGQAITPLLAAQGECTQQDMADLIIDTSKQFDAATQTLMIKLAQEYRQAEKNTPPDFTTNPPTNRNSVFCQKAPKNSELNGLVQAQDPANNPEDFFDPASKTTVLKGSQPNTFPFGTSGSSTISGPSNSKPSSTDSGSKSSSSTPPTSSSESGNDESCDAEPPVTATPPPPPSSDNSDDETCDADDSESSSSGSSSHESSSSSHYGSSGSKSSSHESHHMSHSKSSSDGSHHMSSSSNESSGLSHSESSSSGHSGSSHSHSSSHSSSNNGDTSNASDCPEPKTVTVIATSTSTACPEPTTVTVTASSSAATITASAPASASGNLQTFTGALGGVTAPSVTSLGGGNFQVQGNAQFKELQNALVRSCDVQHNQCANKANASGNKGAITVDACGSQQQACDAQAKSA